MQVIHLQEHQLKALLADIHRLEIGDLEETGQILANINKQSKVPAKSATALIDKLQVLLNTSMLGFLEDEQERLVVDYISAWQRLDFDYIHTHTAAALSALKNSEDVFDECLALLESVESDVTKLRLM